MILRMNIDSWGLRSLKSFQLPQQSAVYSLCCLVVCFSCVLTVGLAMGDGEAAVANVSSNEAPKGFVQASGTKFTIDGEPWYCAGTNQFHVALMDRLSESDVKELFRKHAKQGANVMRIFAHSDGYGFPNEMQVEEPIQPKLGEYNEKALRRLDLVLAESARNGIKLILPFTNYEPFLGGIQWYAEQVLGPGADKELFYTDPAIKDAYKKYVKMMINRRNTITGILYKDDPTIMAWELMNEPHTRDGYERSKGIDPGTIVLEWIEEMAPYIKSLDSNHMLLTGEEGYMTNGKKLYENDGRHNWINNGLKGTDFKRNSAVSGIDAATIHAYPDNWGFTPETYTIYGDLFIKDRAQIAKSLNKPLIMEEYGMREGFLSSRDTLLSYLQDEANQNGVACTLVWAVHSLEKDSHWGYNFLYGMEGTDALLDQYNWAASKSSGKSIERDARQSSCLDEKPPNTEYSCQEQKKWGKCLEKWMEGYCKKSCGMCTQSVLLPAVSKTNNKYEGSSGIKELMEYFADANNATMVP